VSRWRRFAFENAASYFLSFSLLIPFMGVIRPRCARTSDGAIQIAFFDGCPPLIWRAAQPKYLIVGMALSKQPAPPALQTKKSTRERCRGFSFPGLFVIVPFCTFFTTPRLRRPDVLQLTRYCFFFSPIRRLSIMELIRSLGINKWPTPWICAPGRSVEMDKRFSGLAIIVLTSKLRPPPCDGGSSSVLFKDFSFCACLKGVRWFLKVTKQRTSVPLSNHGLFQGSRRVRAPLLKGRVDKSFSRSLSTFSHFFSLPEYEI